MSICRGRLAELLVSVPMAALLTCGAQGQTPHPTLLALPQGWSELPDTDMASAGSATVPDCDYGTPCEIAGGGILSYSGAALDVPRQRIVVWGGGHNDFFGNQLLLFDLATLSWRLEQPPTSVREYGLGPDYKFLDGTPVSRHTYDHMGIIDHLGGVLFEFSGACAEAPRYNAGDSFGDVWTYDFVRRSWTDHTPAVTGVDYHLMSPGASGEYDPVTQQWYQLTSNGVWSYDFGTRAWTQLTDAGPPGIERSSVLDTRRRKIWSYGGDYGGDQALSAFDIGTGSFDVVSTTNAPGSRSAAGLTYDPVNDELVLFGGATDSSVWSYDPATAVWTRHRDPAAPPPVSQVYSRFLYEPVNDVFLLVPNPYSVWVWKRIPEPIFGDGFEGGDTSRWGSFSP